MADAPDIRDWALAEGLITAGRRGPLPRNVIEDYEAAHGGGGPAGPPAGDDVSEPGPPPADDLAEKRPRSVQAPRGGRGLAALRARTDGKAKGTGKAKGPGKARPAHPRVPVDKLIAGGWRVLANFARPLPATSRLLKLQAPVAGVILEDAVRGSVVDKILQPLARAEEGGKAMAALLGPPLIMTAIQLQPSSVSVLMPVLRESLLIWCEVAGPRMAQAVKREADFEETYGATVDDLIQILFAAPPQTPDERAEDDEIIRDFIAKAAAS